ncbi:MAG: hypothetical protein IKN55_08925 [Oscillospiraceae bacterium]|nr:hypothetical protein [Oscillospiraceae bacterium]
MKLIKGFVPALVCLLSLLFLLSGMQTVFAYETIRVNIPVNCLAVNGNNTHTYELIIVTEDDNAPKPVSDTLTIKEDSSGTFEIDLTEPGTYHYTIYEVAGSDAAKQYDSSRYNIVVYAENNENDGLRYSITAYKAGTESKAERISFQDIVLSDTETTTTEPATEADTTTSTDTSTTESVSKEEDSDIIDNILTGDSFPAHAIRLVILISAMAAIFAFLFKRNQNEEDEKNE